MVIITLTGPSGSGKTTIKEVIDKLDNFGHIYNFTTREPRNDAELDQYQFVTREFIEDRIKRGLIISTTEYNGNLYGNGLPTNQNLDYIQILDQKSLPHFLDICEQKSINVVSFYLDVNPEEVKDRMLKQGRSLEDVEKRLEYDAKEFDYNAIPKKYGVKRILNSDLESTVELIIEVAFPVKNGF